MATLSQDRKEDLALRIERAASWVNGPRRVALMEIAEELRGTAPEETEEVVAEKVTALDRATVKTPDAGAFGTTASSPELADGVEDPMAAWEQQEHEQS